MKTFIFPGKLDRDNTKPLVAVLGKLESVHIGHKELLRVGRELADSINGELLVMIYTQRPGNNNILSIEERIMFINEFKPEYEMIFEPSSENYEWTYEMFEDYLKDLGVEKIVSGNDFTYGHNKLGNVDTLKEKFDLHLINEVKVNGIEARSSLVREAIVNANLELYKEMMGHYFFYKGKVVRGLGNGKKFNMPTANVEYPDYKLPMKEGIYYSYVIYDGQRLPSLTSISNNPTLDAIEITYETYIYNFDKDIYGEEIYVELINKFRDPIKFNSIDELVEQLEEDKKLGQKYFDLV